MYKDSSDFGGICTSLVGLVRNPLKLLDSFPWYLGQISHFWEVITSKISSETEIVHFGTFLSHPIQQSFHLSHGQHCRGGIAFSRTHVNGRIMESFRLEKTLQTLMDISVSVNCEI